MAIVADLRKNVIDTTPVFAAVGLTDLAVEKVRYARLKAATVRADIDPTTLQAKAQARVTEAAGQAQTQALAQVKAIRTQAETVVEQAQELPALALNRGLEIAGKAQETYETVATRGEKLVRRVRTQKSTKDLVAQAEATFALGKGAVTTVRKSATDIQRSAKATLTTGHKQAVVAADAIADSVAAEATEATATVTKAATATRSSGKRTATTTKKSAAATKSAAKGATTSAKKTAIATKKASTTAAKKVGA